MLVFAQPLPSPRCSGVAHRRTLLAQRRGTKRAAASLRRVCSRDGFARALRQERVWAAQSNGSNRDVIDRRTAYMSAQCSPYKCSRSSCENPPNVYLFFTLFFFPYRDSFAARTSAGLIADWDLALLSAFGFMTSARIEWDLQTSQCGSIFVGAPCKKRAALQLLDSGLCDSAPVEPEL